VRWKVNKGESLQVILQKIPITEVKLGIGPINTSNQCMHIFFSFTGNAAQHTSCRSTSISLYWAVHNSG